MKIKNIFHLVFLWYEYFYFYLNYLLCNLFLLNREAVLYHWIADQYLEIADGRLEDLYKEQIKVINEMNTRYKSAIESHVDGFEQMLAEQTEHLKDAHDSFIKNMQVKFNVEDIRSEFSNLKKLNEILLQVQNISKDFVKAETLNKELQSIREDLGKVEKATHSVANAPKEEKRGLFGW